MQVIKISHQIMNTRKEYYRLSSQEVDQSRREHGANILTPPVKTPLWKLYLKKFNDPLIRILLVAAVISLILAFVKNDFLETLGVFLAIFFATTVRFYFERDATKKFEILNAIGEEQPVKVKRNGHILEIARKDVVVGDLILLEVGDEIGLVNDKGDKAISITGTEFATMSDTEASSWQPWLLVCITLDIHRSGSHSQFWRRNVPHHSTIFKRMGHNNNHYVLCNAYRRSWTISKTTLF